MDCNRNNTLHKCMSSNTGSKTAHFFNLFWLLDYLSTILFLITSFFFNATNSQKKKARPHSFSRRCAWSRLARTRACLLFARGGASWRRRSGCSEANVNALARDESDQRGGRGGGERSGRGGDALPFHTSFLTIKNLISIHSWGRFACAHFAFVLHARRHLLISGQTSDRQHHTPACHRGELYLYIYIF